MWVAIYKTYGQWHITVPFKTKREVEKHADLYLKRPEKDYIKNVEFIYIPEMEK